MGGFLKHKTCDLFSLQLPQDQDRSGDFFDLFIYIYFLLVVVVVGGGGLLHCPLRKIQVTLPG